MTAVVDPLLVVLADIATERRRQDAKWGEQNHPDGTDGGAFFRERARWRRQSCQAHSDQGTVTWRHILDEEVHEETPTLTGGSTWPTNAPANQPDAVS